MVTPNQAESILRTIRTLMERATIYRAVSANTAILGGSLALAWGGWGVFYCQTQPCSGSGFILSWIIVCLFVNVVNAVVLHKQAWLRGDRFVSPGMKLALRGILPPVFAAAALTVTWPPIPLLVTLWMMFYGLALLSTQEFAPDSIQWLGRAFILMGVLSALLWACLGAHIDDMLFGSAAMALSFGLFHLIYGVSTLRQAARVPGPDVH